MGQKNLKTVSLYVTADEYESLKAEAADHGVTLSYFVRALIDQYSPVKLPPLRRRGGQPGNRNRMEKLDGYQAHN